ncbi:hypothetical protein CVCC1112_1215, partial [Paenarthrobacter nicotinovorans]
FAEGLALSTLGAHLSPRGWLSALWGAPFGRNVAPRHFGGCLSPRGWLSALWGRTFRRGVGSRHFGGAPFAEGLALGTLGAHLSVETSPLAATTTAVRRVGAATPPALRQPSRPVPRKRIDATHIWVASMRIHGGHRFARHKRSTPAEASAPTSPRGWLSALCKHTFGSRPHPSRQPTRCSNAHSQLRAVDELLGMIDSLLEGVVAKCHLLLVGASFWFHERGGSGAQHPDVTCRRQIEHPEGAMLWIVGPDRDDGDRGTGVRVDPLRPGKGLFVDFRV